MLDQLNQDDYELKILKTVVETHLDKTIAFTEEGLKSLESNRDRHVWELSTKIYSQSGHKVEFHLAKDMANSWLESKKKQLAKVRWAEAEKVRQIAAEKAYQVAEVNRRIAEREAIEKDRIGRRTLLLKEIDKFAEQIADAKLKGNDEVEHILNSLAYTHVGVFFKTKKIFAEQLCVEENIVNLESNIKDDLNADSLDVVELIMAIEEEFDIEIPDEVAYEITTVEQTVDYIYYKLST